MAEVKSKKHKPQYLKKGGMATKPKMTKGEKKSPKYL